MKQYKPPNPTDHEPTEPAGAEPIRPTDAEPTKATDPEPTSAKSPFDIFRDPANFVLSPIYSTPVEQVLLRLAVKRPHEHSFFRVHPDEALRPRVLLFDHGETWEMYLVHPSLHEELINLARPYVLYFYITREGISGLWPVRLPGPNGRTNAWWDTGHSAADYAIENWVRVEADASAGSYKICRPRVELPDPQWPALSLSEILRLGFQGRVIDSAQHFILKKLLGEV